MNSLFEESYENSDIPTDALFHWVWHNENDRYSIDKRSPEYKAIYPLYEFKPCAASQARRLLLVMARVPPYTAMTMKWLRKEGYVAGVVEKWIGRNQEDQESREGWDPKDGQKKPLLGFRKDFLGFIDIIAINGDWTIGVQSTSHKMKAKHIAKIIGTVEAQDWAWSPHRQIWLVTWEKRLVKKGGKAERWYPTVTVIGRKQLGMPVSPF